MPRPLILVTLCACALASRGNDDEARFKPKPYEPRQTLRDRSYRESAYVPSGSSPSESKRFEAAGTPSRWRLFDRDKKLAEPRTLSDAPQAHEAEYKQGKQISVSTLKADPRDVPEHNPFKASEKKLGDAAFKAKAESREKNPLLAPRQGIKAPE